MVGVGSASEFPSGFGSAAQPDQNQADTGDPTGQKRPQCSSSRHGEGSVSLLRFIERCETGTTSTVSLGFCGNLLRFRRACRRVRWREKWRSRSRSCCGPNKACRRLRPKSKTSAKRWRYTQTHRFLSITFCFGKMICLFSKCPLPLRSCRKRRTA